MIKNYLLFCLVFIGIQTASAQNISGVIIDNSDGSTIIGASVVVKGTKNGIATDFDGKFSINHSGDFPVVIEVSYLGFQTLDYQVKSPSTNLKIKLKADQNVLAEVNLVEQRLSDKQKESALTVEALDALAIKETPSVSFYDGLGNLKGVDLTSASIGFKIINTRGFNSTSPVRSLQLIDGVDNQAPGLNFALGNFLGASELDVLNVDIIAGASTAFYGPNAFNGVISMTTKNPFDYKGLSASVKYGERNLTEVAVRWADAIKNKKGEEKFAYKFNLFYLSADDWEATNTSAVDESNFTENPTPEGNPGGYDAVNTYGDESPFDDGGDAISYPGLGTFHRNGIEEIHLVDYETKNMKFSTSFHYRFKPDLELTYAFNFGTGTTVYQGDNRISLKGIKFFQNRLELSKKNKWFVRAYSTNEDAGDSYDAYFTALRMQDSIIGDQLWVNNYRGYWGFAYADSVRALPGYPDNISKEGYDDITRWHENTNEIANNSNPGNVNYPNGGLYLTPGTPEYNSLFNDITGKLTTQGGTKFHDKSALYHIQGEYKFEPINIGTFVIGGNARMYNPESKGTIFSDTNGVSISTSEAGLYGGWEKKTLEEHLKLNATLRVDKNVNFDYLVSPALSIVYNVNALNTLRISASSAVRNPTLQDQYLYYNTGTALLVGNINGYDSLVDLDNIRDYLGKGINDRLTHDFEYFNVDPIRPEQVKTIEAGYRTTLFSSVFIDANYYYSWYDDFIGYLVAADIEEGSGSIERLKGINEVYRIATNAKEQVTTQGFSIGVNYFFKNHYSVGGNYTWNVLNSAKNDPIVPAFNTPRHKYNLSLSGRDMRVDRSGNMLWGFNVTYKWIEGFRFEGSPQFTGNINTYDLFDAQVNMNFKKVNTIVKLGASNLLDNKVYQVYGGPQVGRMAYVSILYNWMKK